MAAFIEGQAVYRAKVNTRLLVSCGQRCRSGFHCPIPRHMDSMNMLMLMFGLIIVACVQFGYAVGKMQPCPKCKQDRGASSWKDSAGGW